MIISTSIVPRLDAQYQLLLTDGVYRANGKGAETAPEPLSSRAGRWQNLDQATDLSRLHQGGAECPGTMKRSLFLCRDDQTEEGRITGKAASWQMTECKQSQCHTPDLNYRDK